MHRRFAEPPSEWQTTVSNGGVNAVVTDREVERIDPRTATRHIRTIDLMVVDPVPEHLVTQRAITSRTVPVPPELHAACALAYERARRTSNTAVPGPMRSFLHHPSLSPRALTVAYSAIESNAAFRAFVAEGATPRQVGDAGMAWLHQEGPSPVPQQPATNSQLTAHQQLTSLREQELARQELADHELAPQYPQPTPQFRQPAPQFRQPAPQFRQPAPQFRQPAEPSEPLIRLAGHSQLNQRPPMPPAPPSLDVIDALHRRIAELEVQLESRTNAWREVLRQLSAANERLAQVESVCSNIAN